MDRSNDQGRENMSVASEWLELILTTPGMIVAMMDSEATRQSKATIIKQLYNEGRRRLYDEADIYNDCIDVAIGRWQ